MFHAFEAATEVGTLIFVTASEEELNSILAALEHIEFETHAIGTVDAKDENEAVDKITSGNWEYSQN